MLKHTVYFCVVGGLYSQYYKFLEVALLGQKANVHLVLLDIAKSFSVKIVSFSFPISNVWECLVLYSFAKRMDHETFKSANLVDEKFFQCCFNLHLSYYEWIWTSFHMFSFCELFLHVICLLFYRIFVLSSSGMCILLFFHFRPLMHLEFIFVYGMRNKSNFTFLKVASHCPNAIYYIKKKKSLPLF